MPVAPPSLDARIAACLVAKEHEIDDIAALLKEVGETIGSVEAERVHCMTRSLDPTIVDPDARDRASKAEHMLARLNAAKPRLQKIYDDLAAAERLKAWKADLAKLVDIRDEVATRFRERYCAVAAELIQIFDTMANVDRQIDSLNNRAHEAGARQTMRMTEASARGVDFINAGTKSLLETIRLPLFGLGSGDPGLAWPRPTMPLGLAMMGTVPSSAAPPPSDEERIARSQRLAEEGAERERVKEAMQAAEQQRQREVAVERRRQGA